MYADQLSVAIQYCKLQQNSTDSYVVEQLNNGLYLIVRDNNFTDDLAPRNAIRRIDEIAYNGYVYDLTTENHHFAAGVGNMIVHNTDSVFFTFNLMDTKTGEKIRGQKALEMTIEIAQDAAHLCTQWLKPPMELSYEKTLMPFILLSKKRYVGMLYETDPKKGKLKYMGLSLKRRDSCDYLKDTYGGILNILMGKTITDQTKPAIQNAIGFLDHSLNQLVEGKVPMDKLMITKALRSDYKNPNQIAHKVLADRIGKRDPGNKPKPGDRIKFVFVVNSDKKALQGDKIETPEHIVASRLPVDYTHYITNQLMKPLQQLFGLAVEQIWEHQGKRGAIKTFQKELSQLEKEYPDLETFMKKKEKMTSQKVKVLLFDKILTKIHQDKHGIQPITGFFSKR
jgi:DNA polymerase elongation subunit (family B)